MSLTFLAGYVLGQHGAQSARLAALSGGRSAASTADVLDLHDRVDRLLLVVDAMWSLLEESGYSDEQLRERIAVIDAGDGTTDGRRTPQVALCRSCGARVAAGLPACQFCGAAVPGNDADPLNGV